MNRAIEHFSEKDEFYGPETQNGERLQGKAFHAEALAYYKNDLWPNILELEQGIQGERASAEKCRPPEGVQR